MFFEIFRFELNQWFKKPFPYIAFGSMLGISMLMAAAIAGLLGTAGESNETINSTYAIASFLNVIGTQIFIPVFLVVAIIAPAVYKDFQYNSHGLLFTKPITKSGYLLGRFLSSFLVALFVLSSVPRALRPPARRLVGCVSDSLAAHA